jgi:hypothetical protein
MMLPDGTVMLADVQLSTAKWSAINRKGLGLSARGAFD